MVNGSLFNPSVKEKIPGAYRCWYVLICLLALLAGGAMIAVGIVIKVMDDDISWLVCHIWTGIPLFVGGFVLVVPCATRSRSTAIFSIIFMFICMVVCAAGAFVNGLEYWTAFWHQTKISMDNSKCSVAKGACVCASIPDGLTIPSPISVATCGDLEIIVRLMISSIALDVLGFIVSTMAVFLTFMSVCCGPWVYLADYNNGEDPDFSSGNNVRHTGTVNKGFN